MIKRFNQATSDTIKPFCFVHIICEKFLYRVKRTPQAEHWKGFSPVCVLMCRGNLPAPWMIFWQTGHCWGV